MATLSPFANPKSPLAPANALQSRTQASLGKVVPPKLPGIIPSALGSAWNAISHPVRSLQAVGGAMQKAGTAVASVASRQAAQKVNSYVPAATVLLGSNAGNAVSHAAGGLNTVANRTASNLFPQGNKAPQTAPVPPPVVPQAASVSPPPNKVPPPVPAPVVGASRPSPAASLPPAPYTAAMTGGPSWSPPAVPGSLANLNTSSTPASVFSPPPTPVAPPVPDAPAAPAAPIAPTISPEVLAARQAYLSSFNQSPEEQGYAQRLADIEGQQANLRASTDMGIADVRNKPIPMQFITGQSQNLQEQYAAQQQGLAAQAVPLATRLANEQASRQRRQDMSKTQYGFASEDQTYSREQAKTAADRAYTAETEKNKQFTLGEGQQQYKLNPTTGKYDVVASGAPKQVKVDAPDIKETSAGYIQWNPKTAAWEPLMLNGKTVGSKKSSADIKTSVIEIGGKKLLIDDATGATIKDFGTTQDVEKEKQRGVQAGSQAEIVMGSVDTAKDLVGKTGTLGALGRAASAKIPGTESYNLARIIDTIKANVSFDTLQKMRESSPTGGALGSTSDREITLLGSTIASLDIGQSSEQLLKNLDAVKTHYENWKRTVEQAGGVQGGNRTGALQGLMQQFPGLNPEEYDFMLQEKGFNQVGTDTNQGAVVSANIGGKTIQVAKPIATLLAVAAAEFKRVTGQELRINEAYRSHARQAELYRQSQAGLIGRAAPPGKSFHEKGMAIDVANWQLAEPILRKYGFKNDLADDKNHFSIGEFS